jgi:hypothetical protein
MRHHHGFGAASGSYARLLQFDTASVTHAVHTRREDKSGTVARFDGGGGGVQSLIAAGELTPALEQRLPRHTRYLFAIGSFHNIDGGGIGPQHNGLETGESLNNHSEFLEGLKSINYSNARV